MDNSKQAMPVEQSLLGLALLPAKQPREDNPGYPGPACHTYSAYK